MQKTLTQNYLLSLLYKELNAIDRISALEQLKENWSLKEEYVELKEAYFALPKVYFSPSSSCIDRILKYSRREQISAHA